MSSREKIDKVLLLDLDDVITGGAIGKRVISEKALERMREFQAGGFSVCIITGRSPASLQELGLGKALEKHGLHESVLVYAEHGSLRYFRHAQTGAWEHTPIGQAKIYAETERKRISGFVERTVEKLGGRFRVVPTRVSFCYTTRGVPGASRRELEKAVKKAVRLANFSGEFSTKMAMIPTAAGCDIVPVHSTKRAAAGEFLSYFSNPKGYAFGDRPSDREMACAAGIEFIEVKSPREFIEKSRKLAAPEKKRKTLPRVRGARRVRDLARKFARRLRR